MQRHVKCLVGFTITLKRVNLNDLGMVFSVKICFCVGLTGFLCLAFEVSYVESNEDT